MDDQLIQMIYESLHTLPAWMYLFLLPMFMSIVVMYKVKPLQTAAFNLVERIFVLKRTSAVYEHPVFSYMLIASHNIKNLKFNSALKKKAFEIILTRKFEVVLEYLKEFVDKYTKNTLHFTAGNSLTTQMMELTNNMVFRYRQGILVRFKEEFGDDYKYLYSYIYEQHFEEKHSSNITYIVKAMHSLQASSADNLYKLMVYLTLIHTALDMSIVDCENSFRDINGHLKIQEDNYEKRLSTDRGT